MTGISSNHPDPVLQYTAGSEDGWMDDSVEIMKHMDLITDKQTNKSSSSVDVIMMQYGVLV